MTISVEQIKKLIEDYWGCEWECSKREDDPVAFGRAALYRTVIMDLEKLLPRKSIYDTDPSTWGEYVGQWCEHDGKKKIVLDVDRFRDKSISLFSPFDRTTRWVDPCGVFPPDDTERVWDAYGDPV